MIQNYHPTVLNILFSNIPFLMSCSTFHPFSAYFNFDAFFLPPPYTFKCMTLVFLQCGIATFTLVLKVKVVLPPLDISKYMHRKETECLRD